MDEGMKSSRTGAGFTEVPVREAGLLSKLNVVSAARANHGSHRAH
jgi:hypothetical protein